jgi:rSAM/selenodomain-associated transferase 2
MDFQEEKSGKSYERCKISVIVPVLDEQEYINSHIGHIREQDLDDGFEIIVVDGDDGHGRTLEVIEDSDTVKITSNRGRGLQLNAGAAVARGQILLFLHADTQLPPGGLLKIVNVLEDKQYVGGAFDLGIDSKRLFLRFIAARARFRSRLSRIPYGDQAIFIRKTYFEQIGGFKEIPLMEDIEFMRRIKRQGGKIFILKDRVSTSARRWQAEGVLYTTLRNQLLASMYYLGVSPERLARYYGNHRRNKSTS